jgi:ribonuclease HI
MGFKSEGVLRERAIDFITVLNEHDIRGYIVENSFRDYQMKIAITSEGRVCGHINLYHSPKKQAFTIWTHELREGSIAADIESIWHASRSSEGSNTGWKIYVDGSYRDGRIGYGLVILRDGECVEEFWGRVEDERFQGMNQIGGELIAVCRAIQWCQEHGISDVTIAYDYKGIEQWATGQWQASKPGTKVYYRRAQDWSIDTHWQKIASHSGDYWNDYADGLAKRGASEEEMSSQVATDPVEETCQHAEAFSEFIREHGISASCQGVLNNQFARITFGSQPGYVDIYNTDRRPLNRPRCYGFENASFGERIKDLFQRFISGDEEVTPRPSEDRFSRISYYYRTLKPYRDCQFDFVDLAQSLVDIYEQVGRSDLNIESIRYDFDTLENLYVRIQEETL